jgi:hypothetical protein
MTMKTMIAAERCGHRIAGDIAGVSQAHVAARNPYDGPRHGYPAGGVYLLENRDGTGGNASANTNTAESFQDQFSVDY